MSIQPYPYDTSVTSLWKGEEIEINGHYYQMESDKTISRWRKTKKSSKAAMNLGSAGIQVAQSATGTGTIALATGAAAASATGIGLIVAGGCLTLTANTLSAVSAVKTRHHVDNLVKILGRPASYPCAGLNGARNEREHTEISVRVLPYIIEKKERKFARKVVGAIPVVGMVETARAVGKNIFKRIAGTIHEDRRQASLWLGIHLITHNCALAQAIVAELYSFEEMLYLQTLDSDDLIPLLMEKMKST